MSYGIGMQNAECSFDNTHVTYVMLKYSFMLFRAHICNSVLTASAATFNDVDYLGWCAHYECVGGTAVGLQLLFYHWLQEAAAVSLLRVATRHLHGQNMTR